ncbi:MAG: putative phage tail protein [Butyricicoccus sp.]
MDNEKFVPERPPLLESLPHFLREYREMQEIMKAEGIELSAFYENLERVLNNAFIWDTDEYGISRYEKMFHITPRASDTLYERQFRVNSKFGKAPPYTIWRIRAMLESLCGKGNYTAEHNERYELIVKISVVTQTNLQDVQNMLEQIIPQNIALDIQAVAFVRSDVTVCYAAAMTHSEHFYVEVME